MSSMSKSYESVHTALSAYQRTVSSDSIDDVRLKLQLPQMPYVLKHSFSLPLQSQYTSLSGVFQGNSTAHQK